MKYLVFFLAVVVLPPSKNYAGCYRIIDIPCADFVHESVSTCSGTPCVQEELFNGQGDPMGTFGVCPGGTEETQIQNAPIETVVNVSHTDARGKVDAQIYGGQYCLEVISCNDGQVCRHGGTACSYDHNGYVDDYRSWVNYWLVQGDDCPTIEVQDEEEGPGESGWQPIP